MRDFNHHVIMEFTLKSVFAINIAAYIFGMINLVINVVS